MSDYYEWKLNSLKEALEFANSYRAIRKGIVFRGQRKASWDLKSNLFRGNPSQDEINERFKKTGAFVHWCRQNPRLPDYSDDQILQIAQHYGMYTDLLDFSTSAETAAFFALGSPPSVESVLNTNDPAAIFIVDPSDLEHFYTIANNPTFAPIPLALNDILPLYAGAYQTNKVQGLSRLVAQNGVFVRDVGGTFESLVDGRFSLLPIIFEKEVGHPMLIKKVSFTPNSGDTKLLNRLGCNYSGLFPSPNDLEREISRFFSSYSRLEYHRKMDDHQIVINLTNGRRHYKSRLENGIWGEPEWKSWKKLNLMTNIFHRPTHAQVKQWDIPEDELFLPTPSASLRAYIEAAFGGRDDIKKSIKFCVKSANGDIELPERIQTLLEVLAMLPYSYEELEVALRTSIALFIQCSSLKLGARNSKTLPQIIDSLFCPDPYWESIDVICFDDGHYAKIKLPLGKLGEISSVIQAVRQFGESDIGKNYGAFKSSGQGLSCMMMHRPSFRSLFDPDEAIKLWVRYAIPFQVCFGSWNSAILNPFMVEFIGLS